MDANAKQEVIEIIYRLAYALDALDKDELPKIFAHPFHWDISALIGIPAQDLSGSDFLDHARKSLGSFDATQHLLGNPLVTFSGPDKAHVKVYVSAYHGLLTEGDLNHGKVESATRLVFWLYDLRREGGRWLVESMKVVPIAPWDHQEVFEKGMQRGKDGYRRQGI